MGTRILLVDDHPVVRRGLKHLLGVQPGWEIIDEAADGVEAVEKAQRLDPDVVLLDISMPKLNGWETCRLIREISNVPIIILTGRDDEIDKARGLDLGADDYLTKPFGFVELQARIRATLRRAEMPSVNRTSQQKTGIYQFDSLMVNVPMHMVTRKHVPIALTPTEFRLLEYLLRHANMVLSHHQLLSAVWGPEYSDAVELLKPTVSRLRQKIEEDPTHPNLIQTVHGVGYRLMIPSARPSVS